MSDKLRVFVSSVQKELEDERAIIQNLLNTDAFLVAHCAPVLFEFEPASPVKAIEGCLAKLEECRVYLLIIGSQYGSQVDGVSITHREYRRAKELGLPVLAFTCCSGSTCEQRVRKRGRPRAAHAPWSGRARAASGGPPT